MEALLISVGVVAGLGLLLGLALALADKYISVPEDERVSKVQALLPGANCGSCGRAGCAAMAKALCSGEAVLTECPVMNGESREKMAQLLGTQSGESEPKAAVTACGGGIRCTDLAQYEGLHDCRSASSGLKGCPYGCVGMMSCAKVCPAGAISKNQSGVPEVGRDKCIGCGKCVQACPKGLVHLSSIRTRVVLRCSSKEKGKAVKTVCSVGCIGCGLCAKSCEQNAITMLNGHPVIDNGACIGCGKCAERCPQHSLFILY